MAEPEAGAEAKGGSGFMGNLRQRLHDTHLHDVKVKAEHMKNNIGKFANILNPNHRHDEEHEKITDEKRQKVRDGHRFNSFAPMREGNQVKWYVDARDYFWAISIALENAKETIYIEDWWLSPELFLRRPPHKYPEWRLDQVLKRRAEAGVQIYVVVYKEVEAAIANDSNHTKTALRALCPPGSPGHGNIHVMRHPDHNVFENAGDMTFYWAHHEKFVVIDYNMAFIGGLDLCFGRWDTRQHQLSDVSPAGVENTLFPGQDYNNNRILDFSSVKDWTNNPVSKAEYGRMPWHDVHMGLLGPTVYDIAEHFVLRWNFVKRDKYKRDDRFDWLCMEGRTGEDEDLVAVQRPRHPVGQYIHHPLTPLSEKTITKPMGNVHAQIVRSSADWSSGILVEHSIQNAYKEVIRNAQHYVYIENQFFITATGEEQKPIINTIGEAIVEAIVKAGKDGRKFRVIIVIPAIPGFAGDLRSSAATGTRAIMDYQYKSIYRGPNSIFERVKAQGINPEEHIFFFNLRSYDRINWTPALAEQEKISGVKYQDVQQANAEESMGSALHGVEGRPSGMKRRKSEENIKPPSEAEKKRRQELIDAKNKFQEARKNVAREKFNDVDGDLVADSKDTIAEDALLSGTLPSEELWNKDEPETEMQNFIQEELYPHDKLLIADDKTVLCGSSNINDRSQCGFHDSELTIVLEDQDTIDSTMDGKPYKASKLAATLRRTLWQEHLGIIKPQPADATGDPQATPPDDCLNVVDEDEHYNFVADPLGEDVWKMWTERATTNTEIFRGLFHADPDDNVKNWDDYDRFLPKGMKAGHIFNQFQPVEEVKKSLDKIKGHLVWFPLHFLEEVDMAERGLQVNNITESIYT